MKKLLKQLSMLMFAPVIFIARVFLVAVVFVIVVLVAVLTAVIIALLAVANICVFISGTRTDSASDATDTFPAMLWNIVKESFRGLGKKKWRA